LPSFPTRRSSDLTQSKDHLTLRATIFKSELSEPSSYPFATNCHHSQRARHDKCFRTFEKNFDVDNHTNANQEERYENRITNKLNPAHNCQIGRATCREREQG